jgi:hypothetical protein
MNKYLFFALTTFSIQLSGQSSVGGQKDAQGCLIGAGYQWSMLLSKCIRPFELKTQLLNKDKSYSAGILFSRDKQKSELFCKEGHSILKKIKNNLYKGQFADRNLILQKMNGKWFLTDEKSTIYYLE